MAETEDVELRLWRTCSFYPFAFEFHKTLFDKKSWRCSPCTKVKRNTNYEDNHWNFEKLSRCADAGDWLRILPFEDRDHQVQLGATRKMIDIRLAIRSVMVQCLHHLLIQSDDHDVWPNVEFIATSHRMRLVWHPEAAIHI